MYRFIIYSRKSRKAQDGHEQFTHQTSEWEINNYLQSLDKRGEEYEIVDTVEEDFSGYGYYTKRPLFRKIVERCKKDRTLTLLAAKPDRIARDAWTGSELLKTINMVVATMPDAQDFELQLMFSVAEKEVKNTSDRFKHAAAAKKANCIKTGEKFIWGANSPKYGRNSAKGNPNTRKQEEAKIRVERLRKPLTTIVTLLKSPTYREIADKLTQLNEPLPSGKSGEWKAAQVQRVMDRLEISRV